LIRPPPVAKIDLRGLETWYCPLILGSGSFHLSSLKQFGVDGGDDLDKGRRGETEEVKAALEKAKAEIAKLGKQIVW